MTLEGVTPEHDRLASVVRQHASQLAAALMRVTGDFATAEDLVQDAVLAALRHWPTEGIPDRPDAWLFTVARRRALDGFRRADNYRAKLAQLQGQFGVPNVGLTTSGALQGGAATAQPH